jgi:hypothetical protein
MIKPLLQVGDIHEDLPNLTKLADLVNLAELVVFLIAGIALHKSDSKPTGTIFVPVGACAYER